MCKKCSLKIAPHTNPYWKKSVVRLENVIASRIYMQLSPLSLTENNSLLYNKFSTLAVKILLADFKAFSHHMNIRDMSMPKKPLPSVCGEWSEREQVSKFFGHWSQAGNIYLILIVLLHSSWEDYKR